MPAHRSDPRRAVRLALVVALLAAGLAPGPGSVAAAEYHWIAATGNFTTAANWSPARNAPAADDRLVFDTGGTITVTHFVTTTVGQFVVTNNTQMSLSGNPTPFGPQSIIVAGGSGTDFDIFSGSSLRVHGDKPMTVLIKDGATARIAGTYVIDTFGLGTKFNQFTGEAAEAIQVVWGGIFEVRSGQQSNPFNRSLQPIIPNMARFQSGSAYFHNVGDPPTLSVTFDPGSRFIHNINAPPALVGRTYGDFEFSAGTLQTVTGAGDFTVDSLVVSAGRLNIQTTGTARVRGSINVRPDAYLRLGSTSGTLNLRLEGPAVQTVQNPNNGPGGSGLTTASGLRLIVDNPSGVKLDLGQSLDMAGVLEFQRGIVSTGPTIYGVRLRYGTGATTGASASTGWYNGYMLADITPGSPAITFPFGDETNFAPYTLTVHGLSDTARVGGGFEDSLASSWFDGSQLHPVKRLAGKDYYITVQRDTGWSTLDATFFFPPPAPGDPLQFVARVKSQFNDVFWRATNLASNTATSLAISGLARRTGVLHHYFALGEPSQVLVSVQDAAAEEGASAARRPVLLGAAAVPFRVSLSEPAVEPIQVDYEAAGGTAQAGVDFEPTAGTLVFPPGDTASIVQVSVLGDGDAENHESVTFLLTNASNAVIDRAAAAGTILDDDDVTPPTATVLYPNGGETVVEGSTVDLEWSASDNVVVEAVDLLLSKDGGNTWEPIASGLPNSGSHPWQAPIGLTQQALLRVVAADHRAQTGEDVSDAVWSIWGVDGVDPPVPSAFRFDLASPNPVVGAARLRLALTREQRVRLLVHDVRGRRVGAPLEESRPAGTHVLEWSGGAAGAGVYFVTAVAEEGSAVRRIVRLR